MQGGGQKNLFSFPYDFWATLGWRRMRVEWAPVLRKVFITSLVTTIRPPGGVRELGGNRNRSAVGEEGAGPEQDEIWLQQSDELLTAYNILTSKTNCE